MTESRALQPKNPVSTYTTLPPPKKNEYLRYRPGSFRLHMPYIRQFIDVLYQRRFLVSLIPYRSRSWSSNHRKEIPYPYTDKDSFRAVDDERFIYGIKLMNRDSPRV